MSFLDRFWYRSAGNRSSRSWKFGGSFDSQTESDDAAPRNARFSLARLHICGGVRYMNTHATQLSGMSPRLGPMPDPFAPSPRPDTAAPISQPTLFAIRLRLAHGIAVSPPRKEREFNPSVCVWLLRKRGVGRCVLIFLRVFRESFPSRSDCQRVRLSDLRVLVISWGPGRKFGKGGHKDQVAVEHHVYHWAPIILSVQKSTE
jgi:hypothetical protein